MARQEFLGELTTEQVNAAFEELALACGHSVLGRLTELPITDADFDGDFVLQNLSTAKVVALKDRQLYTVKSAMPHSEIVTSVLRRTHPDVYNDPKGRSAIDSLCKEYVNIDTSDPDINDVLVENLENLLAEKNYLIPDLMRGMAAFGEAEQNRWSGIYEVTLIRPAMLMAGWMIAHERNEPLA